MKYFDIYYYVNPVATEGHAPDQIYARVPVIDPTDGVTVLAWLCRVNEDQYNYMVEENADFRTWETIPTTGSKSKIKQKIKDKDGKDKSLPTVMFGSSLRSPSGEIITPNTSI